MHQETSLIEDMDGVFQRIQYSHFLNDLKNPPISFEEWQAENKKRDGAIL